MTYTSRQHLTTQVISTSTLWNKTICTKPGPRTYLTRQLDKYSVFTWAPQKGYLIIQCRVPLTEQAPCESSKGLPGRELPAISGASAQLSQGLFWVALCPSNHLTICLFTPLSGPGPVPHSDDPTALQLGLSLWLSLNRMSGSQFCWSPAAIQLGSATLEAPVIQSSNLKASELCDILNSFVAIM